MKTVIAFIMSMFWISLSTGQNVFSHRFDFGYPAAVLTGVVSTDSCYYAVGVISDTVAPFHKGNLFAKFNLDGELLHQKMIVNAERTYEVWRSNLKLCPDGGFVAFGTSVEGYRMKALLIKYGAEGDSIFTSLFPNYFSDTLYIRGEDILVADDGGFWALSTDTKPDVPKHTEIRITRLDSLGAIQWSSIFGAPAFTDLPARILPYEDGLVVAGSRHNGQAVTQDFIFRDFLLGISVDGEERWEYLSPNAALRSFANDMVVASDGGFFIVSGHGTEFPVNAHHGQPRWHNYAFKLNAARQQEWGVLVRDSLQAISPVNSLSAALELGNGEGFVVAGNLAEFHPERSWHVGVMAKITVSGSLVWQRHYQHLEGAWFRHHLYGIAQSPDGGFVMVGEVRDTINAPRQQGWLLKVDEHGCLVPGCELVSTREAGAPPAPALHLYPNPASETLYVLLKDERIAQRQGAQLRLLDMQGRPLRTWPAGPFDEVTSVLPLQGLPAGVYVLQYVADGQVLGAERVVVR